MGYGSCIVWGEIMVWCCWRAWICLMRDVQQIMLFGMHDIWCGYNHYALVYCVMIFVKWSWEMYCVINVAFGIACMACDIWCIICVYIKRVCVTLYMTRDNGCIFDACCQNFGWWFLCDVWRLVEIECVHDDAVFFSRYGSLLMDAHTDALYPRGMVWGLFSMHVCEVCGQDAWYLMHYVLCMHGLWCLKFTYYDMCDVWWCLMCVIKKLYVWVWSSQC